MTEKVVYKAAWHSDPGEKMDEDSFVFCSYEDLHMLAVADGVGSLGFGDIASAFITDSIKEWFDEKRLELYELSAESVKDEMLGLVYEINRNLNLFSEENNISFGSTLTFLMLGRNSYIIVQIGDSRAYIYDRNLKMLEQITVDQVVSEYERETGTIIESVDVRKKDKTLVQCLGKGEVKPKVYSGKLPKEFDILLCSDGLSNTITGSEIRTMLKRRTTGKTVIKALAKKARENGERDNITAGIIRRYVKK